MELRAVGTLTDPDLVQRLGVAMATTYGLSAVVGESVQDVTAAYNPVRRQYAAPWLLALLRRTPAWQGAIVLGLTEADLYADGQAFVFGQAELPGRWAVISLYRLRSPGIDRDRFLGRAVKEGVHEVGHTLGLGHCPEPTCVMHFSNTLADTDLKTAEPCPDCRKKLQR